MQVKKTAAEALMEESQKHDDYRANRMIAVARVIEGETADTVAAEFKKRPETVRRWVETFKAEGVEGLAKKQGRQNEFLIRALGDEEEFNEEIRKRLLASAPGTWMWLRNERKIPVTLTTVYGWRKKLLKYPSWLSNDTV